MRNLIYVKMMIFSAAICTEFDRSIDMLSIQIFTELPALTKITLTNGVPGILQQQNFINQTILSKFNNNFWKLQVNRMNNYRIFITVRYHRNQHSPVKKIP